MDANLDTSADAQVPVDALASLKQLIIDLPAQGVFCTGIENSDPWVDGVRRDQLTEAFDFYTHYETRIRNIHLLGLRWLRFGPCYSQTHRGPDQFEFGFCDKVMELCGQLNITIIADLLHFGLPRWLHEDNPDEPFFQNSKFPARFATYARAFAKRYPRVTFFTLVNEPFVTAYFCAKLGLWNEQIHSHWEDDRAFVNAAKNIARAGILAREAIEDVWREEQRPFHPVFIQNESFELAMSEDPARVAEVERFNLRRFATLDLLLGISGEGMREYLLSQGMALEEFEWFMKHGSAEHVILGIDHYPTCVHIFRGTGIVNCDPTQPSKLFDLTVSYWERYRLPMLHTETNAWPDHALSQCQLTYDAIVTLRMKGYPILGMSWYGDEYQVGWVNAMVGPHSYEENHVGLFYKGKLQPVGKLFGELAQRGFPPLETGGS